jgi:hypothetical protein
MCGQCFRGLSTLIMTFVDNPAELGIEAEGATCCATQLPIFFLAVNVAPLQSAHLDNPSPAHAWIVDAEISEILKRVRG